ncbi:MAG: threonylcarbamoyl-AMP synthase [Bacteroidales bacterium]|jgi:tRNA threonylcarbamoyl adenosine modification protein (Sua5/YciO/YrdC/YwlC family)|nr:threonylcarbamoyl-AMP synthase [Bacteroidales bacterium]
MLLVIHPQNPDERGVSKVVECLRRGGIVVYPTDTVYGIGCDITNQQAIETIIRYKDINLRKTNLSMVCYDMSQIADYVRPIDNSIFRLMKRNLPGPFTFILEANSNIPKIFRTKKRTVGVRIPDNKIISEIVRELGNPVLSASVKTLDGSKYITDPIDIANELSHIADIVIDGGIGGNEGSTVVDCTNGNTYEIIRQGIGELIE